MEKERQRPASDRNADADKYVRRRPPCGLGRYMLSDWECRRDEFEKATPSDDKESG